MTPKLFFSLDRIRSTFRGKMDKMDKMVDAVIATPGKVADAVMKSPHRQRKASAPLSDATNESSESGGYTQGPKELITITTRNPFLSPPLFIHFITR